MYKLFLTLRYLRKRRIAYAAVGAVTLCAAMVLIVMSVLGGFVQEMKAKARALLGDVILDNRSYHGFPLYEELIAEISTWPEIQRATPVLYSWGLLRFPQIEQTATVRVVGVRLDEVYEVNGFRRSLYYEQHYPGTTSLAPQAQAILGVVDGPQGGASPGIPRLPEPLHTAHERARAAGLRDTDEYDREWTSFRKALEKDGITPYPGVFALPDGMDDTPRWQGEEFPGLVIGRDIVAVRQPEGRYRRLGFYPRGYVVTLTLLPTTEAGDISGQPIKRAFRYADDSRTGVHDIDSNYVYCDFALLQRLLQMDEAQREDGSRVPGRCSQIQIKIAPGHDPAKAAERLTKFVADFAYSGRFALNISERELLRRARAETWEQSQRHVIAPIEKERVLMQIVMGIISLVAVLLVLCILYMIVLQKTRDVGVLKSVGASSTGVGAIFVLYGAAVGAVGGLLGAALGWTFMMNINEVQELLISIHPGMRVWDFSVYAFDRIPSRVELADALGVFVASILACTGGSFAAAWRAARMEPVEALRYE